MRNGISVHAGEFSRKVLGVILAIVLVASMIPSMAYPEPSAAEPNGSQDSNGASVGDGYPVITDEQAKELEEFEKNVSDLEEFFLSDVVMTDEHRAAQESLLAQLNGGTLDMDVLAADGPFLKLNVSKTVINPQEMKLEPEGELKRHYEDLETTYYVEMEISMSVVDASGELQPAKNDVSAEYRILSGSASIESGRVVPGAYVSPGNDRGTLTIAAGQNTSAAITVTVIAPLIDESDGGREYGVDTIDNADAKSNERWDGARSFSVQLCNATGLNMYVPEKADRVDSAVYEDFSTTVPIRIHRTYKWFSESYQKGITETNPYPFIKEPVSGYDGVHIELNSLPGTTVEEMESNKTGIMRQIKRLIADGIAPGDSSSPGSHIGFSFTTELELGTPGLPKADILGFEDLALGLWGQAIDGVKPFVELSPDQSLNSMTLSSGEGSETNAQLIKATFSKITLPPFAYPPSFSVYYNMPDNSYLRSNTKSLETVFTFEDTYVPFITGASAPVISDDGGQTVIPYTTGQTIPITVTFSEPVTIPASIYLVPGGGQANIELPFVEVGSVSKQATCYYTVPFGSTGNVTDMTLALLNSEGKIDPSQLTDTSKNMGAVVDGFTTMDKYTTTISFSTGVDTLRSFESFTVGQSEFEATDTIQTVVTMREGMDRWLWQAGKYDENVPAPDGVNRAKSNLLSVRVSDDGGEGFDYPLYAGGEGKEEGTSLISFIPAMDFASLDGKVDKKLTLLLDGVPVPDIDVLTVSIKKHLVNVEEAYISSADIVGTDIYYDGSCILKLFTDPDPHNAVVTWESGDPGLLAITKDPNDQNKATIVPTKAGEGSVTVTCTVDNHVGEDIVVQVTYRVFKDGSSKRIAFDDNHVDTTVVAGSPAALLWSSNVYAEASNAAYKAELFAGYHPHTEGITEEPLSTVETTGGDTIVVLDGSLLTTVSQNGIPSYTVRVTALGDEAAGVDPAYAFITVREKPATIALNKPANNAITDAEGTYDVGWTIGNFTDGEIEVTVRNAKGDVKGSYKYPSVDADLNTTLQATIDGIVSSGDAKVKETYQVKATIRNATDPVGYLASDSFALDVYSKDFLKILINGNDADSPFSLENISKMPLASERYDDALKLSLSAGLLVDTATYGQALGAVSDSLEWSVDNAGVLTINSKRGLQYNDVSLIEGARFSPYEELRIAGVGDGQAEITVKHAATGLTDTAVVNVETLKDKLYLFKFNYALPVTATYYSGGEKKTATSPADGKLVIYEAGGIDGEVTFKATSSASGTARTVVGLVPASDLVSGEGNAATFADYKVNHVELYDAAKTALSVKLPDGTPYKGAVTYRSAVYKNGFICPDTINSEGITLEGISTGYHEFEVNETELTTSQEDAGLVAGDVLEFMFEIEVEDVAYMPLVVSREVVAKGSMAKHYGDTIVRLVEAPTGSAAGKPVITQQSIDYQSTNAYRIDVTNYTDTIGPSNMYPVAVLETVASWAVVEGADPSTFKGSMKLETETGSQIGTTQFDVLDLPFAKHVYTRATTAIDDEALKAAGIGKAQSAKARVRLDSSTVDVKAKSTTFACPFTILNACNLPNIEEDDALKDEIDAYQKTVAEGMSIGGTGGITPDTTGTQGLSIQGIGALESGGINMSTGNSIIDTTLVIASHLPIATPFVSFMVKATENPLIYRGITQIGVGKGENAGNAATEFNVGPVDVALNYAPSITDIKDWATSPKTLNEAKNAFTQAAGVSFDWSGALEGFHEVEIRYHPEEDKWRMHFLAGGVDLNVGVALEKTINGSIGFLPVTMTFGTGGGFESSTRIVSAQEVNDFFTKVRFSAYVSLFGGIGFDYSVMAAKIGVYGEIGLSAQYRYLNQAKQGLHSFNMGVNGEGGAIAKVKFLFLSAEAKYVFGSFSEDFFKVGDYEAIQKWVEEHEKTINILGVSESGEVYYVEQVDSALVMESRDYLDQPSEGLGIQALEAQGIGSYPYANPLVTRDGTIMAYMSDGGSENLDDTRASWATLDDEAVEDKGAIDPIDNPDLARGDSGLVLDGESGFATAAWVRQNNSMDDVAMNATTVMEMYEGSEVFASVYSGGSWATTQLTKNFSTDMAPVTAAAGGNAIVAWRTPKGTGLVTNSAGEPELAYDNLGDAIVFKTYDGTNWATDPVTLYQTTGETGKIKGLDVAALNGRRAMITYTIDTTGAADFSGYEARAAIINLEDGSIVRSLALSTNEESDQNVKVTAVKVGNQDYFLTAWHNMSAGDELVFDIKLRAFDSEGNPYDGFAESALPDGPSTEYVSTDFRFAKGAEITPDNLNLLYTTSVPGDFSGSEDEEGYNVSAINTVKFYDTGGVYQPTSAHTLFKAGLNESIDTFDAYMDGDMVKLVSLLSVDAEESWLSLSEGQMENGFEVEVGTVSADTVFKGMRTDIPVTIKNTGFSAIKKVAIEGIGEDFEDDQINIAPGKSVTVLMPYEAVAGVAKLEYKVTATFPKDPKDDVIEVTGAIDLPLFDLASGVTTLVKQADMERVVEAVLMKAEGVDIDPVSTKVMAGLFTDPACTEDSKVTAVQLTEDEVTLLNSASLTKRFTYPLDGGIPEEGMYLYTKVWAVDGAGAEIVEAYPLNNSASTLVPNLMAQNGNAPYRVDVISTVDDGTETVAEVEVRNLTMQEGVGGGNLRLQLFDADGNLVNEVVYRIEDAFAPEGGVSLACTIEGVGAYVIGTFELDSYNPYAPIITADLPSTLSLMEGTSHTLTVSATVEAGELGYQWFFNGNAIDGATSPSYTFPSAQKSDAGDYKVVVTNIQNGEVDSIAPLSDGTDMGILAANPSTESNVCAVTVTSPGDPGGSDPGSSDGPGGPSGPGGTKGGGPVLSKVGDTGAAAVSLIALCLLSAACAALWVRRRWRAE